MQFRLADIYLPDPVTVVYEFHREDVLRGKVIEMCDRGELTNAFVVVTVNGFPHPMIVPVNRVLVDK